MIGDAKTGYTEIADDEELGSSKTKDGGTDGGPGNGHDPAQSSDPAWPTLQSAAYHGLAGEVVAQILPDTESDPAALLLQYLVSVGNIVGRQPYYQIEKDRHYTNLFAILAGESSKARKGTAAGRVPAIFRLAAPEWAESRVLGGMSSGEGVIAAVRDPVYAMRRGEEECGDAGIADKRLLLDEREFFQALAVLKREGNILSRVVRDAWDCQEILATLTKHNPTRATQAFISIIGHITIEELRQALDHTSMANGYANRFLFACVRRSKFLPHGGALDDGRTQEQARASLEVITAAQNLDIVTMDAGATRLWGQVSPSLAKGSPGLLAWRKGQCAN